MSLQLLTKMCVVVSENRRQAITNIRNQVAQFLVDEAPNVYGVNTGFGALAEVRIPEEQLSSLQTNLLRSHATGVGQPYDASIRARRVMASDRADVLLLGTSGVRVEVPELLVSMLN